MTDSTTNRIVLRDAGAFDEGSAVIITRHKDGTVSLRAPRSVMADMTRYAGQGARGQERHAFQHSHEQILMNQAEARLCEALDVILQGHRWYHDTKEEYAEACRVMLESYDEQRHRLKGDRYNGIGMVG